MRSKLFYIIVAVIGLGFIYILGDSKREVLSFYGFAESNQTEINYNHPVVVQEINVTPGQAVKPGEVLMKLARVKSKESLSDQEFKIDELYAESRLWQQKKKDQLDREEQARDDKLTEIDLEIKNLQKEIEFKSSLVEGLSSIKVEEQNFNPILNKITELETEKVGVEEAFALEIQSINNELTLGKNPYLAQVNRLKAEAEFEESQKVLEIVVNAPTEGLIGNIFCKEAEHVPSYKTLLSFYEPHSGIIRGYVHEDLTLEVEIGTLFRVSSLKDENIHYPGKVIGLGSRIVEIPTRLRKLPGLKTYGREVLIEISKENSFLQKEKVALSINNEG